jgi:hypothetical protein
MSNTCENCKHYHSTNPNEGACRRFPPQAAAPNYFQFPGVRADMNCGEFQTVKNENGRKQRNKARPGKE